MSRIVLEDNSEEKMEMENKKIWKIIKSLLKKLLKFFREGWLYILLPTLIVIILIILILLFVNPYDGNLHGKYIILYSLFG